MSNLAAWPLKIDEEREGIVIHVHGSEHFLYHWEVDELAQMMIAASQGKAKFGEDYQEIAESIAAQAKPKSNLLLAKLGLTTTPAPIKRRSL